jgi:hypothetical protein
MVRATGPVGPRVVAAASTPGADDYRRADGCRRAQNDPQPLSHAHRPQRIHYPSAPQLTLIPHMPVKCTTIAHPHHQIGTAGKNLKDCLRTFVVDPLNLGPGSPERTLCHRSAYSARWVYFYRISGSNRRISPHVLPEVCRRDTHQPDGSPVDDQQPDTPPVDPGPPGGPRIPIRTRQFARSSRSADPSRSTHHKGRNRPETARPASAPPPNGPTRTCSSMRISLSRT